MQRLANSIDGAFVGPATGEWIDVYEPATGKVYAQAPASDARDIDLAVAAATRAFPAWAATPANERSRLMLRLADLIDRDCESLARAESIDTGKPISLARRVDIPRAAANVRFFATAILHDSSDAYHTDGQALNYTLRKPRGVAGLIAPWNLPLYLLTWKIAPAIATGNTCVAKPSEVTPMTAHLLGILITEAGLPPGVVNIVHGDGANAGAALVEHPDVPTISFTGSTRVGSWIASRAGERLKRVSLELGGKNPNIIFADADLEQSIPTAAAAAFTNQGQICLCGSRILVERSIHDEFIERFIRHAKKLRPGDPSDEATQFGALTSEPHLQKVESAVGQARRAGGKILCGGARTELAGRCESGWFYPPTVIAALAPDCPVQQEEIFGPVVTVTPFDSNDEAVSIANSTPYGLAAMVWTRDITRAHKTAARLDAGIVWINCWMLRDLRTPFGGAKQSGVGREGGSDALRFFTEPTNVCVRLGDQP